MPILNYTTKIPVEKTIGEIEKMLAESGAQKILKEYDNESNVEIKDEEIKENKEESTENIDNSKVKEIKQNKENNEKTEIEKKSPNKDKKENKNDNEEGKVNYELLNYLFSFLDTNEELNYVLAGYFSKVFIHLMNHRQDMVYFLIML